MANTNEAKAEKKTRGRKVDYTWNGNLGTREVKVDVPAKDDKPAKSFSYTARGVRNVTDISEAAKLLKLSPKNAIKALVNGANSLARAAAASADSLAERVAQHMNVSIEDARALLARKK